LSTAEQTVEQGTVNGEGALSRTRAARRRRLLDVARAAFLRDGYRATTMEGVAAAAAVSKTTLYKYFADKDDLLLMLVRERRIGPDPELMRQTQAALEQTLAAIAGERDADAIEPAMARLLRVAGEGRGDGFLRLTGELAFDRPALLARVREATVDPEREQFYTVFEPQLSAALPPELPPDVLLSILYALITGYRIMAAAMGPERLAPEHWATGLATLLRRALTPGR